MTPQANSLSSITQLAGNPPRYPRNPAEPKRDSLVLYIARVPGSRDVILTTMKPRLKNVTAEDVLNCLYYFHVDTPSDVFLMGDMQVSEASEPIPEQPAAPITRKPLREGSAAEMPKEAPQLPERGQKTETTLSRAPSGALKFRTVLKPVLPRRPLPEAAEQQPPLPPRPSTDSSNLPSRRPLGPRPYLSQPETNRKPLQGIENIPARLGAQQLARVAALSMNNPYTATYSSSEALHTVKAPGDSSFSLNSGKATTNEISSITLIRRDPTSGAQWNIGMISRQQMLEDRGLLSVANSNPHDPCSSIAVQLTTLGYGQFRPPQEVRNIGAADKIDNRSREPHNSQHSFARQVRMTWSKPWERKYKQHGRASSDQTLATHAALDSGFLSPWNGRCEFSVSTSGRCLKCKHTLTNPTTVSNPATSFSGTTVEVSELRFNLPSSSITNSTASKESPRRPASAYAGNPPTKIDNNSPGPPPTSYAALYPSDNEEEDDDPNDVLDLSLGREKAGGGIRGKRVKLGKLIVHDEGLKMLDLVVAANMGVWWTVWER